MVKNICKKVGIFCLICSEQICKYCLDINSTGAVYVGEARYICNDCSKKIAIRLIKDN